MVSFVNIDKFGNRLPTSSGGMHYQDQILYDYVHEEVITDKGKIGHKQLLSDKEIRELQKELKKHRVFHPDDDFADHYRATYGEEIPIEVFLVKVEPAIVVNPIDILIRVIYPYPAMTESRIYFTLVRSKSDNADFSIFGKSELTMCQLTVHEGNTGNQYQVS